MGIYLRPIMIRSIYNGLLHEPWITIEIIEKALLSLKQLHLTP